MDNFDYVTATNIYLGALFIILTLSFTSFVIYIAKSNKPLKKQIKPNYINIFLLFITLYLLFVGWYTMSSISTKIADWADFATCLTALFALISIYLAYRAFMGQVNASRRASFDATFTQIFAQHNTLRARVISHKNSSILSFFYQEKNVFTRCVNLFYQRGDATVWDFWNHFNRNVIGNTVSIDFNNFFKYIYHEVNVVIQANNVLDPNTQTQYIHLIQAQMNNDELFCYLINQISHYHNIQSRNNNIELDRTRIYAEKLKEYDFFREISKNIGLYNCPNARDYSYYIEEMYYDNHTRAYIEIFINQEYLRRLSV